MPRATSKAELVAEIARERRKLEELLASIPNDRKLEEVADAVTPRRPVVEEHGLHLPPPQAVALDGVGAPGVEGRGPAEGVRRQGGEGARVQQGLPQGKEYGFSHLFVIITYYIYMLVWDYCHCDRNPIYNRWQYIDDGGLDRGRPFRLVLQLE